MSSDADIVLSVRNVSKCFVMYEKPVHRLCQTLFAGHKKSYKEFWALRDISFDVHRGECVGIIGRNGAGKSTLLQIITGTLAPTTGEVKLKGRVAALLELGSCFNPEFTGRENVYLNGSILGLTREEIDERYDEILAFADIGNFIDQPVKTYSSGMMVRLAFAVQVMVDPDVLIVDEALAVGDAAFQRKCFARMDALQERGTAILLVTHDTGAVKERCTRAIYIKDHIVSRDGDSEDVVADYMRDLFPAECDSQSICGQGESAEKSGGTLGTEGSEGYVFEKLMNPGEMHSCGAGAWSKSTIAFGEGGAQETVKDGETGIFFQKQSVESLCGAIEEFEGKNFSREKCMENANRFSIRSFMDGIKKVLEKE